MPSPRTAAKHMELGTDFYDVVAAADFPKTILRYRNRPWSARVGLDGLSDESWIAHFGRFQPLPGSLPQPLALRYHGHQFRSYNPDLGDGRGFLFAQLHDLVDGRLLDLATKGSGTTPWSRTADGRLTLKGGMREILATSMLEALGVNTSKSFSLIETGEDLERGDEPSPARSSVLVRLSHSHIRIGSFQRLLALDEPHNIQKLLDYTVGTYLPDAWREETGPRAVAFLEEVCRRVARTGAQWMAAGFVHGVLNTDNINVTGESFDYGPWRFAPASDPSFTAAYFDVQGLYSFGRQPEALFWNLSRLSECLMPLADREALEGALKVFGRAFRMPSPRPSSPGWAWQSRRTRRICTGSSPPSGASWRRAGRRSSRRSSTGMAASPAPTARRRAPPPPSTSARISPPSEPASLPCPRWRESGPITRILRGASPARC